MVGGHNSVRRHLPTYKSSISNISSSRATTPFLFPDVVGGALQSECLFTAQVGKEREWYLNNFTTLLQLEWINGIAGGRFLIPVGDPVCLCTYIWKHHYNRKEDFSVQGVMAHTPTEQEQPPCRGNLPPLEGHGWEVSGVWKAVSALCQKGGSTDSASLRDGAAAVPQNSSFLWVSH